MSDNRQIVRDMMEAFNRGDIDRVMEFFHPDIELTMAEGWIPAATFRGKDAVLKGVFRRPELGWGPFADHPGEIIGDGDTLVVIGKASAEYKATGKKYAAESAMVLRFRDGKIVSWRDYIERPVLREAQADAQAAKKQTRAA